MTRLRWMALTVGALALCVGAVAQGLRGRAPAEPADVSALGKFDILEYSEWLLGMEAGFSRYVPADQAQLFNGLNTFHMLTPSATGTPAARDNTLARWGFPVNALTRGAARWPCGFLVERDEAGAIQTTAPSVERVMANTEGEPFYLLYLPRKTQALPARLTVHPGFKGSKELRLRIDPEKPTAVQIYASGIATGKNEYMLILESPDGKEFHRRAFTLNGVTPGRLKIRLLDGDNGQPTEALAAVYADGQLNLPRGTSPFYTLYGQTPVRDSQSPVWPMQNTRTFIADGTIELPVLPGPCRVVASKGPEYRLVDEALDVAEGAVVEKDLTLRRFIDMRKMGWISGDDHVHVPRDPAIDPYMMDLIAAVDVDMTNIVQMGDEERMYFLQAAWGDPSKHWRGKRLMWTGQEDPRTGIRGHILMYNLQSAVHNRPTYLLYEDALEAGRKQGGLVGYAHNAQAFNAESSAGMMGSQGLVDFVELDSASTVDTDSIYHLWNLGLRFTVTAGSDFPFAPMAGTRRFYAYLPGETTVDGYLKAVKEGHTFQSCGSAVLDVRGNGQLPGTALSVKAGDEIQIAGKAFMNPDFDKIGRVEIVRDGEVVSTIKADASGQEELEIRTAVKVEESGWIAVRLYGGKADVAGRMGDRINCTAHTTPFWVEVAGKPRLNRRRMRTELPRARAGLDQLSAMAQEKSPLLETQRDRLMERIEKARDNYAAMEKESGGPLNAEELKAAELRKPKTQGARRGAPAAASQPASRAGGG